jgi:hypothetical protein
MVSFSKNIILCNNIIFLGSIKGFLGGSIVANSSHPFLVFEKEKKGIKVMVR